MGSSFTLTPLLALRALAVSTLETRTPDALASGLTAFAATVSEARASDPSAVEDCALKTSAVNGQSGSPTQCPMPPQPRHRLFRLSGFLGRLGCAHCSRLPLDFLPCLPLPFATGLEEGASPLGCCPFPDCDGPSGVDRGGLSDAVFWRLGLARLKTMRRGGTAEPPFDFNAITLPPGTGDSVTTSPDVAASTDAVGLSALSDAVDVLAGTPATSGAAGVSSGNPALSDAVGVPSCVVRPPGAAGVSSRTAALSDAVGASSRTTALSDAVGVSSRTVPPSDAAAASTCAGASSDPVGGPAWARSSSAGCSGAGWSSETTVPSGVSASGEPSMLPGGGGTGDSVRSVASSTSER